MGKTCVRLGGLFLCLALAVLLIGKLGDNVIVTENEQIVLGELKNLTVCIDPGHGGYDGGAVGRESKELEKTINLQLAKQLKSVLETEGARVILTRDRDIALADSGKERKRRDLTARVQAAQGADIFLSLHMNEYPDRTQSGPQVFYTAGDDRSRLLSGALQNSMNSALAPVRPRSANTGDYFVLRNQQIPAVLIECGFLSNAQEEALLLTEDYRLRVAQSIRDGLLDYLHAQANLAKDE